MMLLVHDFEKALGFYSAGLGMTISLDLGSGASRLLQLSHQGFDAELWLVLAESVAQRAKVGLQGRDHPLGVIYTTELEADLARLAQFDTLPVAGVVNDPDGAQHCRIDDLYGNRWVMVQLATPVAKPRAPRRAKVALAAK